MDVTLDKPNSITVVITKVWSPLFARYVPNQVTPVRVKSTAGVRSTATLCFVGLAPSGKAVVHLDKSARLLGKECCVHSNSNDPNGLTVEKGGRLEAKFVCSSGGIKADKSAELYPTPIVDCPPVKDPLQDRPTLHLNSDFQATDIPLPDSLVGGNPFLDK